MSDNKCKNCRYCVGSKDVKNIGTEVLNCFYGPPVPYPLPVGSGNISVITIRPAVNAEDWCSHWKVMNH